MFSISQIKDAHSKVKSGADFPAYIQALVKLGVEFYETYVTDGHTDYFGANDFKISSEEKYNALTIKKIVALDEFKINLKAHQQGKTDYATFCNDCAKSGIEKWTVCLKTFNCTYYDLAGNILLVEEIPH